MCVGGSEGQKEERKGRKSGVCFRCVSAFDVCPLKEPNRNALEVL